MQPVFEEAERLLGQGEPFALATVVRTRGSTPQKPGAKLLVRKDGSAVGTLGGGCVEADVWAEARTILDNEGGSQVRRFDLNEDIAAKDGLVCGGSMEILIDPIQGEQGLMSLVDEILASYEGKGDRAMATLVSSKGKGLPGTKLFIRADGSTVGTLGEAGLDGTATEAAFELMSKGRDRWIETKDGAKLYVESFTTPATLVIAGGGHVGKALYTAAKFAGFKVIIVDDRPMYANQERFPDADAIIVDDFDKGLRSLEMTPNYYVIVATRGHKLDDIALLEAARSRAGYIGLLGSKRKAMLIYRDLVRQGIPIERIAEVRAPVGLDLGGRTPEEIAISIVSEMLAERYERRGGPMTMGDDMIEKARQLASKPVRGRPIATGT